MHCIVVTIRVNISFCEAPVVAAACACELCWKINVMLRYMRITHGPGHSVIHFRRRVRRVILSCDESREVGKEILKGSVILYAVLGGHGSKVLFYVV